TSIIHRWLYGLPAGCTAIPYYEYKQEGNRIAVKKIRNYRFGTSEWVQLDAEKPARLFSKTYWMGTDRLGRDVLSRLIIGARVSLVIGAVAVIISLITGILLGALAGYYRGRTDQFIS